MEKIKNRTLIVVFILFMAVGIGRAEPTPTIKYLMDTPVSMFDFGIYKFENYLASMTHILKIGKIEPSIQIQYSYDLNRISIMLIYIDGVKDIQNIDIKKEITRIIGSVKISGFNFDRTGKPLPGVPNKMYGFFRHEGYVDKDEPINIGHQLEQITEIYVEFYNNKKIIKCSSPLIGNKIHWEK